MPIAHQYVQDCKLSCSMVENILKYFSSRNEKCENTVGGFTCGCVNGYRKEGSVCVEINECLTATCPVNSVCEDLVDSFVCNCNRGYQKNGG